MARWHHAVIASVAVILFIFAFNHHTSRRRQEVIDRVVASWDFRPRPTSSTPEGPKAPPPIQIVESPKSGENGAAPKPASLKPANAFDLKLDETKFDTSKDWKYQQDTEFVLPKFAVDKLKTYAPHNWKGPGHESYALYFASRNATMQDPYFAATLQVLYRLLWDSRSKSRHTVLVLVPPFVSTEHRDYFKAAGAIVREIGLHPFEPKVKVGQIAGRLADMFGKLDMWEQTDFSLLLYMDSDAFPLVNIDALFTTDLAPLQRCRPQLLQEQDRTRAADICDYVFAAHEDRDGFNAGVMVLKPNKLLHSMLFRDSKNQDLFDNGLMEQGFLSYFYRADGPFPWSNFSLPYNSSPNLLKDNDVFVLHAKLWDKILADSYEETKTMFTDTWSDMVKLYESAEFIKLRQADGLDTTAHS